jgi:integration host factor subunit beta
MTAARMGEDEDESGGGLTRNDLIGRLSARHPRTPASDVADAVRIILEVMTDALAQARVIEIRGFGTFCLHYYRPILGRNPRSGQAVALEGRYVPHFRPGRLLRSRLEKKRVPIKD